MKLRCTLGGHEVSEVRTRYIRDDRGMCKVVEVCPR
jgi:predicted ABC-type ATPase